MKETLLEIVKGLPSSTLERIYKRIPENQESHKAWKLLASLADTEFWRREAMLENHPLKALLEQAKKITGE